MSRWIPHGPRAVFNLTLAGGLTLVLASVGLAPAMSEPDGPASPSRGGAGTTIGEVDPPVLPTPRDPLRAGGMILEPPRELPAAVGGLPQAIARFEGTPAPGRRVTLRAPGARAEQARVRWHQIRGAAVQLDHPTEADASFTVPQTDDPLGFLLVVANARGIDSAEISIPVQSSGRPGGSRGSTPTPVMTSLGWSGGRSR